MDCNTLAPVILIVDDDPTILLLLNRFLGKLAPMYDIITAGDAQSALPHLAQRTVPLLITDYMMVGMDGLQLTAAVKAASPTTYVILISGDDSAELKQRALSQQVDTFLPKADLFDRLVGVVRSLLCMASPKE